MSGFIRKRVAPTGPQPATVMLIGGGPAEEDEKRGHVFAGQSGRTLDANLSRVSLFREGVRVRNMVNFRAEDESGDPSADDIARDLEDLEDDVERTDPRVIGTLGRVSTRHFLGDVDMEAVHGIPHRVGRGLLAGRVVVPCYHPAAGLHNQEVASFVFADMVALSAVVRGQLPVVERRDRWPNPQYKLLEGSRPEVGRTIAIDTEGWVGRPFSLQFSDRPGMGYMILATNKDALRWFQGVVDRAERILIHNAMYDLQLLLEMGINIPFDKLVDSMMGSYLLRTEPQGLKPLAYRYESMKMQDFNDLTRPYVRKQALTYLREVASIGKYPKPDLVLERDPKTGNKKARQPQPLHTRVASILSNGDPEFDLRKAWHNIDPSTRWFGEELFGKMPEFDLALVPIADMVYYACRDTDATIRVWPHLEAKLEALGLMDLLRMKMDIIPITDRMQRVGMPASADALRALGREMAARMKVIQYEINEYNDGKYINTNSGDQIAEFLFQKLGLPPQRLTKSKKRFSTNDKTLKAIKHYHKAVALVSDGRGVSKVMDAFCDTLPDHVVNGRVHPTIRLTRVTSGRKSTSNPNLSAIPVRSEDGRKVRGCFQSPPGRLLGSCDLDQVEMRVMADESRDPRLLALFREGRDIHRQTASDMFGVKLEDVDEMRHRYPAKRVGFGVITGIAGPGLLDQMYLAGITEYDVEDCERMIADWFKIYPGVSAYMEDCRREGRRRGYVQDRWGMPRYVPGCWSPIPKIRAEDERATHSHKIQAGAQGLIQRAEARVHKIFEQMRARGHYAEVIMQIHDELVTEHDEVIDPFVEAALVGEMTAESSSFAVPIKAKYRSANNWGSLK